MQIQLLLRAYPPGVDSYYYLLHRIHHILPARKPQLYSLMISSMPVQAIWQFLPAFLLFLDTLILYFMAKKHGAREPWIVGLALLMAPLFLFRMSMAEDDIVFMTFFLLALYTHHDHKYLSYLWFIPLAMISELWKLGIVFFLVLDLPLALSLALTFAVFVYITTISLGFQLPGENHIIPGLGILMFLPYFVQLGQLKQLKYGKETPLLKLFILSIALSMTSLKFMQFAVPGMLLWLAVHWHERNWLPIQKWTAIMFAIASLFVVYTAPPPSELMECLKAHPNATYDWSLGYWEPYMTGKWINWSVSPFNPKRYPDRDISWRTWREDCSKLGRHPPNQSSWVF
jgi:hypothetical protein